MKDRPTGTDGLRSFVERYQHDVEEGSVRSFREYLELYPDDAEKIALLYAALRAQALPKAVAPGDCIGHYRLEELIGRGGQGLVYRARHTRTDQRVALKVLANFGPVTERLLQYFKREALIAARFDHPGLCPVYDAGIDNGVPYIAMRYVDGQNLEQLLECRQEEAGDPQAADGAASPVSLRPTTWEDLQTLLLFVEGAARAIQAAHESGAFHRDIKPSNIMVTTDGKPVVLDFGLSHLDDPMLHSLTRTGDLVGTPRYMSPEQLTRRTIPLDGRTDIWSLGVVLYECTTLRLPFESVTREGLFMQILTQEPLRPRKLNRALTRDTETVILTALEKNRSRRYQTAFDFAEDLRRIRMREPILAVPPSLAMRTLRWAQRHPGVAIASGLLVLSLSIGLAVSLSLLRETNVHYEAALLLQAENELLADDRILSMLDRAFDELWPANAALSPQMRDWIENANRLLSHRDNYSAALRRIAEVESTAGFAPTHDHAWRKELFQRLAAAVGSLRDRVEQMQRRLDLALTLEQRTITDHLGRCQRAADELANDDRFRGMPRLQPQLGLVPLGPDPESLLQEFAVFGSGEAPARDAAGQLQIAEESAIVLVLLPAGKFEMGSPEDERGRQEYEALAEMHLTAFLIGKHEVSQAQWLRVMGVNPASAQPGNTYVGLRDVTLLHPVEGVTWLDCELFVRRLGLQPPSEAQWEYACRAGTTTAYPHGNDVAGLQRHSVNLADAALLASYGRPTAGQVPWNDGYVGHAPISTGDRNLWGIVAMLGNVSELCRDAWMPRREPILTWGDGLASSDDNRRVARGGCWLFGAEDCRSASREAYHPTSSSPGHGLRVGRSLR